MANFQSTWLVLLRSCQLPAIMRVCSCLPRVPGISSCFKNGDHRLWHVLPKHREHTSLCLKELTVWREEEWGLYVIYRARLKWTLLFVWSWKTYSEQKAQNKIQLFFFLSLLREKPETSGLNMAMKLKKGRKLFWHYKPGEGLWNEIHFKRSKVVSAPTCLTYPWCGGNSAEENWYSGAAVPQ